MPPPSRILRCNHTTSQLPPSKDTAIWEPTILLRVNVAITSEAWVKQTCRVCCNNPNRDTGAKSWQRPYDIRQHILHPRTAALYVHTMQVACGPSFCLAITASGVWSWGTGEGYVLGHGDTEKREMPCPMNAFRAAVVLQVSQLVLIVRQGAREPSL